MRASFAKAKAPVLAGVVKERTVRDSICAIKNTEAAGATAIDLHLSALEPQFKNAESIKQIIDCTNLPMLVLNYNQNYGLSVYECSEDGRVALLERGL